MRRELKSEKEEPGGSSGLFPYAEGLDFKEYSLIERIEKSLSRVSGRKREAR